MFNCDSSLFLIVFIFFVKTISAQDGIYVNIGASYFAPLEIESDNDDTYLEAHVFFPSPLLEFGYLKSLNDKDFNIGVSFKTTFYHQGFTYPEIYNDTVSEWLRPWESINMANFDLKINLEKGIFPKKNSILYGSFSIGMESLLVSRDVISIPFDRDTLQITGFAMNNRMHFSPAISGGLIYRIENKSNNYWQFSINYTQVFTNLGSRVYNLTALESGKLAFRGSSLSLKAGYLFQFKRSKQTG